MTPAEGNPAARVHGRPYWRYATLLAFVALLCAVLLGGLSAWFLASVAIAGLSTAALTFNFHIPGALVRLFALGRTAAKYGERLTGHRAALGDQVVRRAALFGAMARAPAVRGAGWQMGDLSRLTEYLDDVEDLDYARLRVALPLATFATAVAAGLLAIAFVAPLALVPVVVLLVTLMAAARRLQRLGAREWAAARMARGEGAQHLGAALAAAVPLVAEGLWREHTAQAIRRLNESGAHVRALRRAQADVDGLASLTGPVAAICVIAAGWLDGQSRDAMLPAVFVAFCWLALADAVAGVSRIVIAAVRRRTAAAEIDRWAPTSTAAPADAPPLARPTSLDHAGLPRLAPDGRALGMPVPVRLRAGQPLAVAGPSGSGKTSLLKQIAGWIGDDVFRSDAGPLSASARRGLTMYCPHDAVVLADTVRANLFAPDSGDDALWAALAAVELDARMREAGGLDAWIGQDVLSLGEAQRLNLARAWLSPMPVIVLDEPTEHLEEAQARRILRRLLDHLADRVVILSTHQVRGALDVQAMDLPP